MTNSVQTRQKSRLAIPREITRVCGRDYRQDDQTALITITQSRVENKNKALLISHSQIAIYSTRVYAFYCNHDNSLISKFQLDYERRELSDRRRNRRNVKSSELDATNQSTKAKRLQYMPREKEMLG